MTHTTTRYFSWPLASGFCLPCCQSMGAKEFAEAFVGRVVECMCGCDTIGIVVGFFVPDDGGDLLVTIDLGHDDLVAHPVEFLAPFADAVA